MCVNIFFKRIALKSTSQPLATNCVGVYCADIHTYVCIYIFSFLLYFYYFLLTLKFSTRLGAAPTPNSPLY